MSTTGNFRDLLDMLDKVPPPPPASHRRATAAPTSSSSKPSDVAEQQWIVSGILRLAFSDDDEERCPPLPIERTG
jgi:hypothetical protein